jgi:hypothetical protein
MSCPGTEKEGSRNAAGTTHEDKYGGTFMGIADGVIAGAGYANRYATVYSTHFRANPR